MTAKAEASELAEAVAADAEVALLLLLLFPLFYERPEGESRLEAPRSVASVIRAPRPVTKLDYHLDFHRLTFSSNKF